ncbi:MAG: NAD(+) synthase [Verrucomicrobiales bacterium]|nr:NAD(+) synthase [Verrucomicrobiales bacterium]
MKRLHVAAASLNQIPLDWDGNRARIEAAISEAKSKGVQVLCLPELAITGYGCEDMFLAPEMGRAAFESLQKIAKSCKGIAVAVGLPVWFQSSVFNASALIVDKEIVGIVCKQNLAGDGLHYEPRWFKPWPADVVDYLQTDSEDVIPIGDLVFDLGGLRVGFEICEDAWVAERPGSRLARRGVDLILNPSASHFAFGKQEIRERFVLEGSRAFACAYVYANLLGNEAGRIIYDGGTVIASGGKLVATGKRFSFHDFVLTRATIDIGLSRMQQARQVSHQPALGEDETDAVWAEADFLAENKEAAGLMSGEQFDREYSKEEEFTHAMALGLFDYLRKSYSNGFVVSLSGGADSAACAILVKLMVDLAVKDLNSDGFTKKLGHIKFENSDYVSNLLGCVYQATRNSGDVTRTAAKTVAKAIGAEFQIWDVDGIVEAYREIVEGGIGRKLKWETDDITLQNIQARSRAPGVWMLTNIRNALLLATSNRSEAAVGYATMDGDTSGGLSPISGIDKAFLRQWLNWLETEGSGEIPPIPELRVINEQAPTAELRPQEENQTDEGDLMPYPVLDAIERLAIRDKKLPADVFTLMKEQLDGRYDDASIRMWVIRFFKLWSRNQWKRERYAPGFHLDDENLDPKTWCRFPILSSGFAKELAELEPAGD